MSAVSWVEQAELALAQAGRKRGGARSAVLDLLAGETCALTALEIEDALRGEPSRRVSRASVYRILDELERLRLVQRVDIGQSMVRYERACELEDHHHHLVCDECGLVMPFSDPALELAITSLSERVPLSVSEHEIVLHGCCRDCHVAGGGGERSSSPQIRGDAHEREHRHDEQDRSGVL
jgi:Fur family ferric uptake transcriptional regulator